MSNSNFLLIKNYVLPNFQDVLCPLYHIQVNGDHFINFCNNGDLTMTVTFDFSGESWGEKTFTRDVGSNEVLGIRLHGIWYKKPFNLKITCYDKTELDEQVYW